MPMPQIEEGISTSPILYYIGNLAINLRSRCMYLVTLYYFTYDLVRWFSKFAFRWVGTDWLSDRGHSKLGRKGSQMEATKIGFQMRHPTECLPDEDAPKWLTDGAPQMGSEMGCSRIAQR